MSWVRTQTGVALVLAIMIVALVTTIAVEISWRFELSISRSGNRWHGTQAKAYLAGAEQLAIVVLREDAEDEEANKADHMGEAWAQNADPFPTDHGWVRGRIVDAHGRFNINRMQPEPNSCNNGSRPDNNGVCPPAQSACDRYTPAQRQFIRLLQTVNLGTVEEPVFIETADAELITEAVIDWLDSDSGIRGFGGAESDYYEQLTPPITIANNAMISVSELQVIKGMNPALYKGLLPHVVALPSAEVPVINLNTADAPVLRTLTPTQPCDLLPLSEEVGESLTQLISAGGFTELQQLKDDPSLPSEWLDTNQNLAFDSDSAAIIQSTYFLLYSEAAIGEDHIRRSRSLIKRDTAAGNQNQHQGVAIDVVRRTDANF